MAFTETDACLYIAVVPRRLRALVAEGKVQQNEDGTYSAEALDAFIRREW